MVKFWTVISAVFYCIFIVGMVWLVFRGMFIEWILVRESIVNFINPLIHLKVIFVLLQDPDIYIVVGCFVIANFARGRAHQLNNTTKV